MTRGKRLSGLFYRITVFCSLIGTVSFNPCAAADTVKVFILAGQSNMSGCTPSDGLPSNLTQKQNDVMILACGHVMASRENQWLNLDPNFGFDTGYFGPELAFGWTMADSLSDSGVKVALIKVTCGGTTLFTDWRPPGSGGTTGSWYGNLVLEIQFALAALPSQYVPVVAGMLWMQGEHDGTNTFWANAYDTNLTNLIADIRTNLNQPELPFVAGMIHLSPWWPFTDIVRNAEANAANRDSNVGVFETQDLSLREDSMHYQTDAMVEVGKRYALTMLQVINKTANKPPFIEAGPRQIQVMTTYPALFNLNGSAVDDGNPNSTFALAWEKVSGPGTATFGDLYNPVTTVTLSQAGTYHLRLSAFDGAITSMDAVMISADTAANLALTALSCSTSYCSPLENVNAINDGIDPASSYEHGWSTYGNWPQTGTQWVQYNWSSSISTSRIDVFWYDDRSTYTPDPCGIRMPASCALSYRDGAGFVPVTGASGYGVAADRYNTTTFDEVTTTGLRLEFTSNGDSSTGIIEWKVHGNESGSVKPRPVIFSGNFTVSVTGNKINIVLPRSAENKPMAVRLFDAGGRVVRKVLQENSQGGSYSIGLDILKVSGLYFAEIRYGNETKTITLCRIR
jgi:hypothetical protein